jgi:hypothetical protein
MEKHLHRTLFLAAGTVTFDWICDHNSLMETCPKSQLPHETRKPVFLPSSSKAEGTRPLDGLKT